MTLSVSAQEKLAEYTLSYYKDRPAQSVSYSAKDASYYVSMPSVDKHDKGGMIVKTKEVEQMREVFIAARDKFVEWSAVARQNSVGKLTKDMELTPLRLSYYWSSVRDWYFDFNQIPNFRFMVFEDGSHYLVISSGKLNSSTNQYIDSSGFLLVFSSADEVNAFLECFDPQKLIELQQKKEATEELFK